MATPTLVRRELKNAKVYFIPAGEVVDTVTVSQTTWPDNDPVSNWTGYQIPDIEGVVQETVTEEESFLMPQDSGGYQDEPEMHLRRLGWTATTAKTSSLMKMLQFAPAAPSAISASYLPATPSAPPAIST